MTVKHIAPLASKPHEKPKQVIGRKLLYWPCVVVVG